MQEAVSGEILIRLARFGRLHLLEECASTNDYALSLADRSDTAVVVCRKQTAGRGRFRRAWFSDEDSLTFSVLIPDAAQAGTGTEAGPATGGSRFPGGEAVLPLLTQIAGLAVGVAVEELCGLEPLIRWPNDVLIGAGPKSAHLSRESKLAGILCEQRKAAIAVGIGVNVNQPAFPADVPDPVSLRIATGRAWDRYELLDRVLERLFGYAADAVTGRSQALMDEIRKRSSVLHRRVEVQTMFRRFVGTVVDLDAQGRIVLRMANGRVAVIGAGQARRLK